MGFEPRLKILSVTHIEPVRNLFRFHDVGINEFRGYPESSSEFEITTELDSRLRGNDGKLAKFCHARGGGYPESMPNLVFVDNR